MEVWNGRDWYPSFGDGPVRAWEDARRYGFVSAGGGRWFSGKLLGPTAGDRLNAYIPQRGYDGVGMVVGPAVPFDDAAVEVEGRRVKLADLHLAGSYGYPGEEADPDLREWVLPVTWSRTVPAQEAFREPGMFAKQHPACRLANAFTLQKLAERFAVDRPGVHQRLGAHSSNLRKCS